MFNLKTTLIFCIYLCLTCATSENIDEISDNNHQVTKSLSSEIERDKNFTKNKENKSLTTIAEGVKISPDEFSTSLRGKLLERDAQPSVKGRKGVSSIFPRKGVETIHPLLETEIINNSTELKLTKIEEINNTKSTTEKTSFEVDLMKSINSNETTILMTTEKTPKINKKFRPKPTVTVSSDGDPAKSIISSPTKIPPLGMSSKINYVVPVIITILVLPLFILFVIFLYRNGRECWEKRHYRRMDFLIDGMYNE